MITTELDGLFPNPKPNHLIKYKSESLVFLIREIQEYKNN